MRLRVLRSATATFFFSSVLFVLGLVSTTLPNRLMAQTNTTALSGTVTDPSGAVIPGALVELSNPATGFIKVARSGERGEYTFDQIAPAKYKVTCGRRRLRISDHPG